MKKSGLQNRFNQEELNRVWGFHFSCLWCGKSHPDCFHHIKSLSSQDYQKGYFNRSVLNSCPINNFDCHLNNGELHKLENEKMLLGKVKDCLLKSDYQLKQIDRIFMKTYRKMYE